ncbi:uncharacterized protein LOC107415268 [Ziziphus jujuba]|uniref:Uncharacterized protein LOC107415268 n=2 Tax=Ziziphus jujuba TaxID=326968 RepID=A0A6P3ZHD8_ZIZJJ|nr:uncharacterized protein LOC107415268 [Ziziphus jujuba]KAH7532439.1 hypothetical protein FEM48_Zijuj04G0019900 [Ziziphus jujuba var. spinosa]
MESTTTTATTATGAADLEDDEWELCNDDGFVYKRRKRRRVDPVDESASAPISDPKAEERQRRERKKNTLLKLKERYQREIDQWEHLSNTLRAMEESTRQLQQQRDQTVPSGSSPLPEVQSTQSLVVDDLLLQAEAQEAMIKEVSSLCDIAEAMCNAEEEQLNQSLIDLPIWASPTELMASLCDE